MENHWIPYEGVQMNPGKIRENSIILRSGALCATHWKIIETLENQWKTNGIPLQNHWKIKGKRRLAHQGVDVRASFSIPLGPAAAPWETIQKAWKIMHFFASGPGSWQSIKNHENSKYKET